MYNYKFVKIETKFFGSEAKEDYREIIEKHAEDGWRFVQIFAPGTAGYGNPGYYEIIFEREIQ